MRRKVYLNINEANFEYWTTDKDFEPNRLSLSIKDLVKKDRNNELQKLAKLVKSKSIFAPKAEVEVLTPVNFELKSEEALISELTRVGFKEISITPEIIFKVRQKSIPEEGSNLVILVKDGFVEFLLENDGKPEFLDRSPIKYSDQKSFAQELKGLLVKRLKNYENRFLDRGTVLIVAANIRNLDSFYLAKSLKIPVSVLS